MKSDTKEPESLLCDQGMRYHHSYTKTLPKYSVWFLLFVTLAYFFYSVLLISPLNLYNQNPSFLSRQPIISPLIQKDGALIQNPKTLEKTQLRHIVFGIAASSNLWHQRKSYIKLWWKPKEMRGFVWLDKPVKNNSDDQNTLPPLKISGKNHCAHNFLLRKINIFAFFVHFNLKIIWNLLNKNSGSPCR